MFFRLILNDILKSKTITLTIMVFVAAAAMLVSLAAVLIINLSGAIDTLMTRAETPHFMQMHSGKIDTAGLTAFAEQNGGVEDFQVIEFLNVDGAEIVIGGNSLAGSVQDNGFCTQSSRFDYLLDLDGEIITVTEGELYVPVSHMKEGTAEPGDRAVIGGVELTVAGFLRDSQMNASLASSKRFLVCEKDYGDIRDSGSVEYLIEFRLKDPSVLGEFEAAYTAAGLEANGPTITYPLFKFINAVSDGLMIAVILLVSILIVLIAFMCIRFSLLAKIEDDYREIGVMKAVGLRVSDIKKIYLAKYAAIAVTGSILGYALSLIVRGLLLENIRLYMGESGDPSSDLVYGLTGVVFVCLAIIAYVSGVLQRFRKISASEAIRFGTSQDSSRGSKRFHLSRNRFFDTNVFLGIKDVLVRKKLYATMLAVLVISAFIIIVPRNLFSTISSKNFITYMGVGNCDLRIDIQQTDRIPEKAAGIAESMNRDRDISRFVVLTTKSFRARTAEGSEKSIKIELGDHSVFPVEYSEGGAPAAENDIALSVINAEELGRKIGDTITLMIDGKETDLRVCGIYSDFTNGGKTAKAVFSDSSAGTMWSIICAELSDKNLGKAKVAEYADRFPFAKVSDIDEYIQQTFGSTRDSVGRASSAALGAAILIAILVILLFMKMLVAKDTQSSAVMKASGFTTADIRTQYISRSVFVLIWGILLGTILANTLGEALAGSLISSFGVSSFRFTVNPLSSCFLCPLLLTGAVLGATVLGTRDVGQIRISENIKE